MRHLFTLFKSKSACGLTPSAGSRARCTAVTFSFCWLQSAPKNGLIEPACARYAKKMEVLP